MLLRNLFFVLGMLIFGNLQAQDKPLSGKILSSDNSPVPGATILLKSGKKKTTIAANGDGTFSLSVPSGGSFLLEISAVGFDTKEVSSDAIRTDRLTVTLVNSSKSLNDVVVVGYG